MSVLEEIIQGVTDEAVSTSNLLRKVWIAAQRLQAVQIKAWAQQELRGYDDLENLPKYRGDLIVNVLGVWSGPGGSRDSQALSSGSIPTDAKRVLFTVQMGQSLAELEDYATSPTDRDIGIPWDPQHVVQYNKWAEEGRVPRIMYMSLLSANRVVSRAMIRGVVDAIRNAALEFALELQEADPSAGSLGGPTVADPTIGSSITNITNTIFGDGAQIALGENIRQRSGLETGDLTGLLQAATEAGLTKEGAQQLAQAVLSEEPQRQNKLTGFLSHVRDGGAAVAAGASGDLVAEGIKSLLKLYFGG